MIMNTVNIATYAVTGGIIAMLIAAIGIGITIGITKKLGKEKGGKTQRAPQKPVQKKQEKKQQVKKTPRVIEVVEVAQEEIAATVSTVKDTTSAPAQEQPQLTRRCEVVVHKLGEVHPVKAFDLMKGTASIGRVEEKNDWGIASDQTVSTRHCQLAKIEEGVYVTDLNSTNGTFVNGLKITQPTILKDQDIMKIGMHEYRVTIYRV